MSKGLEAWKYTRENYLQLKKEKYSKCENVNNILERCNKRCDTIEKELKALEIIKTKKVDIKSFLIDKDRELYNMKYGYEDLTQEEYDLLKEVLL